MNRTELKERVLKMPKEEWFTLHDISTPSAKLRNILSRVRKEGQKGYFLQENATKSEFRWVHRNGSEA